MGYMKFSLCLTLMIAAIMVMMPFGTARSHGRRMHYQDSLELGDGGFDERPGNGHGHRHRNHRGRAGFHHHRHHSLDRFEEGLPGLYPIKGPAQPPLILHSHPNRGVEFQQNRNNAPVINNNLPQQWPPLQGTHSQIINQPVQQPLQPNPYEINQFPLTFQSPPLLPTNKYDPAVSSAVNNQLPTSDKPMTTTANPRLTDLLYGSNLQFEEDNNFDIRSGSARRNVGE